MNRGLFRGRRHARADFTDRKLNLALGGRRSSLSVLTCVEKEMVTQVGDFAEAAVTYVAPAEKERRKGQ